MSLELPKATQSVLSIDGSVTSGVIEVRFAGTADVEARADLDTATKQLHTEALRLGASKVIIDLRALEFMNSSCFKAFVSWITEIRDLETSKQYRMHLLSNPNLHWQRRSLAALTCFATDLVTVEA